MSLSRIDQINILDLLGDKFFIMQWHRFKADINSAPQVQGVYYLGDGNKNVIFIGHAQNIHTAILDAPERIAGKSVQYFSCELNEHSSQHQAEKLIREMKPAGNRHGGGFW